MAWMAPKETALIVVDVQNDFCPGGQLAVKGGDAVVPIINRLTPFFQTSVLTQDWHPADHQSFASQHDGKSPFDVVQFDYGQQMLWPDHCVQGTEGAQFHHALNRGPDDLILLKGTHAAIDSYSGFYENDGKTQPRLGNGQTLTEELKARGVSHVVLCGLAYDFCVGWHALDARKEGFMATVISDATRPIAMQQSDGQNSEFVMTQRLREAGVSMVTSPILPQHLGGETVV